MTIYDKIREISGLSVSGKDEDGNLEWIGTDEDRKFADSLIESYENGNVDEDEIEETWKEKQINLPEESINLPNN